MFRSQPRKLVIALLLVALATSTGVTPVLGAGCRTKAAACRCRCGCCGSRSAAKSSCCKKAQPSSATCVCGRQGESPADSAPPNDRRNSQDPLEGLGILSHAMALLDALPHGSIELSLPNTSSFSSPPRLQAVLCRWLT